MNLIILTLKIVLFISMFFMFWLIYIKIKDKNIAIKLAEVISNSNKKFENRLDTRKYGGIYKTKSKRKDFFNNIDMLIIKSNIRKTIPFFTTEIVVIISIFFSLSSLVISFFVMYNIFASLIIASFMAYLPKLIIEMIVLKHSNKIENQLINYMSTLNNFCSIEDNIVYAISKVEHVQEPLKTFSKTFVQEVKNGIPISDALENFKGKIDNKRFKKLMRNLQLCNECGGSYTKVLSKSIDVTKDLIVLREDRAKTVKSEAKSMYALLIIGLLFMYGGYAVNKQSFILFRTHFFGQLIIAYIIFIYIYSIFKIISYDNFKY